VHGDLSLPSIRGALAEYEHEQVDLAHVERRAAVAAVIRPGPSGGPLDAEVLLMRRAERPGDQWSGQMAFPGGHVESGESFEEAARRETEEEVGLDLGAHARVLGALDHAHAYVRARQLNMVVAPIVYELVREPPPLTLNYEVAETLWAPLAPMIRGDLHTFLEWEMDGETRRFPGYDVQGRVVWGMTYRMLGSLFTVLHPEWEPLDW
jgi:8-oxo-dGTP pyrophosphatase MutT (NUDIX family)